MEITSLQIAAVMCVLAVITALWGLFRVLTTGTQAVREEAAVRIESLRQQLFDGIDKQAAIESKSRHDLANNTQSVFSELKVDIERLKRETVRREEMSAFEARLSAMFVRSDAKLDLVVERLAALLALEKQVTAMETRMETARRGST